MSWVKEGCGRMSLCSVGDGAREEWEIAGGSFHSAEGETVEVDFSSAFSILVARKEQPLI